MSSSDQSAESRPLPPASPPGTVQATAILLYVGGALTVVLTLIGLGSGAADALRSAVYVLIGLLHIGLARFVQRGSRWARRTVLGLCTAGVAVAGIQLFGSGLSSAVSTLAWPAVYAILLTTDTARSWFRTV